jgi:hypothetical protein
MLKAVNAYLDHVFATKVIGEKAEKSIPFPDNRMYKLSRAACALRSSIFKVLVSSADIAVGEGRKERKDGWESYLFVAASFPRPKRASGWNRLHALDLLKPTFISISL